MHRLLAVGCWLLVAGAAACDDRECEPGAVHRNCPDVEVCDETGHWVEGPGCDPPADALPHPDGNDGDSADAADADADVAADVWGDESGDQEQDQDQEDAFDATVEETETVEEIVEDVADADGDACDPDAIGWDTLVRMTPVELHTALEAKDFVLINVHIPREGEIPGTDVHIAYTNVDAIEDYLGHDHCANVVLYCKTGPMSVSAGNALIGRGYRRVRDLLGGMNAWETAGYPLDL